MFSQRTRVRQGPADSQEAKVVIEVDHQTSLRAGFLGLSIEASSA